MTARKPLTIGEVINLLIEEFPDVTVSKIRFLESQGAQGLIVYVRDGDRENGEMAYTATSGLQQFLKPDLGGRPIY